MVESTMVPFFKMRPLVHQCLYHLRKQLLLDPVLFQYVPESSQRVSVRYLVAGFHPAELRECTAVYDLRHGCHV